MPRALNTGTCIQQGDLFYSAGQQRIKLGEVLEKNAGEWTGRVEISKVELPGSKRSMYGLKGRTFKLCVLTKWDFNFCVRSSPLRGKALLRCHEACWILKELHPILSAKLDVYIWQSRVLGL